MLVTCTQRDLTATHSLMLVVFIWQQGAVTWHRVVWSVHAMFWGLSQQDKYCRMSLSNVCLTFQWTWQRVRGEDCLPQSLIVRMLSDVIIENHFWLLRRGHWDFPNSLILSRIKKNCNKSIIFFRRDKANVCKIFTNFQTRHIDIQYILSLHTVTTFFSSSANNAMFEYSKDLPNARLYHLSVTWILCSFPMLRKRFDIYIYRGCLSVLTWCM